jgi:hypothetical protein
MPGSLRLHVVFRGHCGNHFHAHGLAIRQRYRLIEHNHATLDVAFGWSTFGSLAVFRHAGRLESKRGE